MFTLKPLSKKALKALSSVDRFYQGKSLGTHAHNLNGYFGEFEERGLITVAYPFVHLTDKGQAELRAYYQAGGKRA